MHFFALFWFGCCRRDQIKIWCWDKTGILPLVQAVGEKQIKWLRQDDIALMPEQFDGVARTGY